MVRIASCKKDVGCNGGLGEKRRDHACIRSGKPAASADSRSGFTVLGAGSCHHCGSDLAGPKLPKFGVALALTSGPFGEWGAPFDDDMP
jgi:hypothetical protein